MPTYVPPGAAGSRSAAWGRQGRSARRPGFVSCAASSRQKQPGYGVRLPALECADGNALLIVQDH